MITTLIPEADMLAQKVPVTESEEDELLPDVHSGTLEANPVDVWEQLQPVPVDEEDCYNQET